MVSACAQLRLAGAQCPETAAESGFSPTDDVAGAGGGCAPAWRAGVEDAAPVAGGGAPLLANMKYQAAPPPPSSATSRPAMIIGMAPPERGGGARRARVLIQSGVLVGADCGADWARAGRLSVRE